MTEKFLFLAILLLLLAVSAYGQVKYEREFRLKPVQVPAKARGFIDSINSQQRVKWYYEQNLKGNSIEAKFSMNQKRYSIEFDTLGNLQDVEIQIGWEDMPASTVSSICTSLHTTYDSFKINKIQVQYTGERSTMLALVKNQSVKEKYKTNYELIVNGKKDRTVNLYEVTFNEQGNITEISEVIFRNTANLEY